MYPPPTIAPPADSVDILISGSPEQNWSIDLTAKQCRSQADRGRAYWCWNSPPTHRGPVEESRWLPAEALYLLEVDADHWKTWVHQRLVTPMDQYLRLRPLQNLSGRQLPAVGLQKTAFSQSLRDLPLKTPRAICGSAPTAEVFNASGPGDLRIWV